MTESTKNFSAMVARVVLAVTVLVQGLQHTIGAFNGNGIEYLIRRFTGAGVPVPEITAWICAILLVAAGLALLVGAMHRLAAFIVAIAALGALWFFFHDAGWDAINHELLRLGLALSVAAFGPGMFAFKIQASKKKDG